MPSITMNTARFRNRINDLSEQAKFALDAALHGHAAAKVFLEPAADLEVGMRAYHLIMQLQKEQGEVCVGSLITENNEKLLRRPNVWLKTLLEIRQAICNRIDASGRGGSHSLAFWL